jgi:hypothetical protein
MLPSKAGMQARQAANLWRLKSKMKATAIKLLSTIMIMASCASAQNTIDMFIMDYPHGEYRIHVERTGEAYLYYGAGPQSQTIRTHTFSADGLYHMFKEYLHPNVPREEWPNPKSQAGMVTIRYSDGTQGDYLIFDMQEMTKKIFEKAKQNIEKTSNKSL